NQPRCSPALDEGRPPALLLRPAAAGKPDAAGRDGGCRGARGEQIAALIAGEGGAASEQRVAQREREEDHRPAGEGGGGGPLAEDEEDPERTEDRLDERDQAGLGAPHAAEAGAEEGVRRRDLQAAHGDEQPERRRGGAVTVERAGRQPEV